MELKEDKVRKEIVRRVVDDLGVVDSCGVNGLCKLFLYEFFVVRRVSWQFLVHDLCLSFAVELDTLAVPFRSVGQACIVEPTWAVCSVCGRTLACS